MNNVFYHKLPKEAIKHAVDYHNINRGGYYRIDTHSPIYCVDEMDFDLGLVCDDYTRYVYITANELIDIDNYLSAENKDQVYLKVQLGAIGNCIFIIDDNSEVSITDYATW